MFALVVALVCFGPSQSASDVNSVTNDIAPTIPFQDGDDTRAIYFPSARYALYLAKLAVEIRKMLSAASRGKRNLHSVPYQSNTHPSNHLAILGPRVPDYSQTRTHELHIAE